MISLEEYNLKYNKLLNSDIYKLVEQTIDENIIKDILKDELILSTPINEETVKKILSLISNKYEDNGWDNLSFILNNVTHYFSDFPYNSNNNHKYKIKYTLS